MESPQEQAIYREIEDFARVWNEGDAHAAASFYTEDGVRVGAMGDIQRGRDELEAGYRQLLTQAIPGGHVEQERGTVRILTSDLALWQGGIEIHTPGDGPVMRGYVIQVMKKVGIRWLILEGHPKFFPPPTQRG